MERHYAGIIARRLIFLAAALLMSASRLASADGYQDAIRLSDRGDILPLEKVLEQAIVAQPGKILEVEFEKEHGVYVYEMKILDTEGRLWELEFNARTGELIETELEN